MMTFLIWAFAFWYGAELVLAGKTDFEGMMKAISAVVFGATMLGQMFSFAPDFGKAEVTCLLFSELFKKRRQKQVFFHILAGCCFNLRNR